MDENGPRSGREISTSVRHEGLTIGFGDASECDASLDAMAFDTSLSFLDSMDALSESVVQLLDSPPTASPASEPSSTPSPSFDASDEASGMVGSDFNGDMRRRDGPVQRSEPTGRVKPATTTRERQREELLYLREKVVELESELTELQAATLNSLAEPSVWEKIAKRQQEAKRAAEGENAKLRELLAGQLRVAKSLEKLLKKRSLSESTNHFFQRKRYLTSQEMAVNASREEIRSRIFSQLDDVDAVMQESGLSEIFVDMDDARATASVKTDDTICMELVEVKVLPFPVEQVAEAMWTITSGSRFELPNGFFDASHLSDSMSDVQFTVDIQMRRAKARLDVCGVSARRTDAGRSKIVYESAGTTQGTLFKDNPIHCRERGFLLIENNASDDQIAPPSTTVKVCVRLWPESIEPGGTQPDRNQDYAPFIDLVIGSYNRNVKLVMQLVENMLLEQTRQPRNDSPC